MQQAAVHPHQIDEQWMVEWLAFGFREIEAYLEKHARFERYCERR